MCKLVDDEREGAPLFPEIMPLVAKRADEISDPDSREMAEKTKITIEKLAAVGPKPELQIRDLVGKYGDMMKVPGRIEFCPQGRRKGGVLLPTGE